MKRYLPVLQWLPTYDRGSLVRDLIAAAIVAPMLIPQALAYAQLAGMPAETGLYASILPLLAYTLFGTSRTLAVGPVALISLMTASAAGQVAAAGSSEYLVSTLLLALLSGLMLLAMGVLRLGFVANFLSHPVISGFVSAAGLLIAASQLRHLLGIQVSGDTLPALVGSLWQQRITIAPLTLAVGAGSLALLLLARRRLRPLLHGIGLQPDLADLLARTTPVLVVVLATLLSAGFGLDRQGLHVLGEVPAGLPPLSLPDLSPELLQRLWMPALLLSAVGFVESVSIAQTLGARRRQRIDPDQELIGLGAANIAASLSGAFPVSGGFARSVVNHDAGAATPAAGAFTAAALAAATLVLTPWLYYLPQAALAATIVVSVLGLVDLSAIPRTWRYSRHDGLALTTALAATLLLGVTAGILTGVGLSLLLYLHRSSRPHCAVVGWLPGTEHFRNIERFAVETDPAVTILRIDEGLYFANTRFIEDRIYGLVSANPALRHLVLMCPAVNQIDASALEALEAVNARLLGAGVRFHLSEVKGPVMDGLRRSELLERLSGQVFLTTYQAWQSLRTPEANAVLPLRTTGDTGV